MTKKSQEVAKELRKAIMDEIFDQRTALYLLGLLQQFETEMQLAEERVSDREDELESRLRKLETKHYQACNLLRDFAKVVENDRGADYHLLYQYEDFLEK